MIKLICFDLWETLVTEPSTSEYCWEPFSRTANIEWMKIKEQIREVLHKKDQSTEQSIEEILKNFGITNDALVAEIARRWNDSGDEARLFPETLEVLRGFRSAGLKIGLITNTSRYGWDAIEKKFALGKYFDFRALSFECGYVKPETAIFQFIEKTSGLSGGVITMIGDSHKSDFEGPRRMGWQSVLLDRLSKNQYPEAKPVVHNLLELKLIVL